MTPRQEWLRNRVYECLENLIKLYDVHDYAEFKKQAHELACELLYAVTEWDKFYRDIGNNK